MDCGLIIKIVYFLYGSCCQYCIQYALVENGVGFVILHYTAGLILSLVFQLAHVIGEADMPLPICEKLT